MQGTTYGNLNLNTHYISYAGSDAIGEVSFHKLFFLSHVIRRIGIYELCIT